MDLSVAMIVKNEEKNMERCLKALRNLDGKLDYEIVVVDTGSTDKTKEIAKKYAHRVYEHKWNGNFADMRNISINYCKGTWILIIDADEVLQNPERLVQFIKSNEGKKYNAAEIIIKNLLDADSDNYISANLFRLFKKNKEFYYVGRVHEQPRVMKPYTNSRVAVLHYGYSREDYEVMKYKYERNKELLEADLKNGVEPIYTRFQLAQTYSMANETMKALDTIKEAYELDRKRQDGQRNVNVYHFYSRELVNIANYKKAIEVAKQGIEYCKSSLDFFFVLAFCYKKLKKYDEAEENFKIYFDMHDKKEKGILVHEDEKKYGSLVDYSFCRYDEMLVDYITCFYENEKYNKVITEFEKLDDEKIIKRTEAIYVYSLIVNAEFEKLHKYYSNEIEENDIENIICVLERVEADKASFDVKCNLDKLYGIDDRLDMYLKCVYLEERIESNKLNFKFDEYYSWKAKILRNILPDNVSILEDIKKCENNIFNNYISYVHTNYECLKVLYEYCSKNYLSSNFDELVFVTSIEKILIFNPSITGDKFNKLVLMTFYSFNNYVKYVYNETILVSDFCIKVLNPFEYLWYKLYTIMKKCNTDKSLYIRGLKNLLKKYPGFKNIIKIFINEIDSTVISDDMIKEKNNLISTCEKCINDERLDEASEIIDELNKLFKYDDKVLLTRGIIKYLKGKTEDALLDLCISSIVAEDKFDSTYNVACILESEKRNNDAKEYYNRAYNICKSTELKEQIEEILKNYE
ncbi:MAG: glycosyltransferase [Clostridiales bacterium]|nr:glycosyltransferase [Clostridiales bacterium]